MDHLLFAAMEQLEEEVDPLSGSHAVEGPQIMDLPGIQGIQLQESAPIRASPARWSKIGHHREAIELPDSLWWIPPATQAREAPVLYLQLE